MKKKSVAAIVSLLLAGVMLLSACTPVLSGGEQTQAESIQTEDTQGGETRAEETQTHETQAAETQGEETQGGETQGEEVQTEEVPTEETQGEEAQTNATEAPETESETQVEGETVAPVPTAGPTFSHTGGVYGSSFSIELSAPEGYTIRYTTNGSIPTTRSSKYTKPIEFNVGEREALTIRAACFGKDNKIVGAVGTHTYVKARTGGKLYTVMISVKESDLDAMLEDVNAKVERPAHVEIVTPQGETVISQDAGLRLFGGSSRSLEQKSFKLIARKTGYFGEKVAYTGTGTFRYALFSDRVIKGGAKVGTVLDRYDSFILRNGGNDSLLATACNPEYATLLRDGLANNFAANVTQHVEYSLSQFATVYINGEYYGLLDMRENLNEDFVKRVWGVSDDDVVVIKSELDTSRACKDHENSGECRYCGSWFFYETDESTMAQATLKEWTDFCKEMISKINASDAEYQAAYEKFESMVDVEGMIEWYALSLYLCNTDWPHNNVKLWKYTGKPIDGVEITDGKWRFMTRDMDMTMGRYDHPELSADIDSRPTVDSFYRTLGNYLDYSRYFANAGETKLYNDALYLQGLLAFALRNDGFRTAFEAYCQTLISEENQQLLESLYDDMFKQIKSEMTAHINCWNWALAWDYTYSDWTNACSSLTNFLSARPGKFKTYLDRCLGMYK